MFGLGKFVIVAGTASAIAATPTIKVDFDQSGRNSSEVTEGNYIPWVVTGAISKDTTLSGVKITINKGSAGTALKTNWYKASIQSPYYAKLVGDGVTVDGGNSGGEISLTFSGLSAGTHSLLAYLNNVDAPEAFNYSNIDVYVNGTKKITVKPSNRALTTENAATAYVSFEVTFAGSATIKFVPSTSSATFRNVTLNGFALNVPNSAAQSSGPIPADLNDHAAHNNGDLTLSWTAAVSAKKHQVYFGTDSAAVLAATSKSAEYKGEQTETTFKVTGTNPLNSYFWRVDEVDANGTITKGDVWKFRIGRLAFEGAEGYGRNAVGGRGGKIVYVTNLNDSGVGSFREAVTNDIGPRTIVFKVAGVINLKSRLVLSSNYVTVAGQTAPGKGITITGAPFGITGNDCVVRFMRVRRGYAATAEEQNRGLDGMGITGANHSIIDHSSISWTTDEAFSSRGAKNITLQRTLISEALNIAGHPNYPAGTAHGYAATIGGDVGSFHHNLLAHNDGRNWSMGGGLDAAGNYAGKLDIFNNVVYNWVDRVTDGGAHNVNFVGNYYKEGAATTLHGYTLRAQLEGTGGGTQEYYYHNNVLQAANGSFTCDGTNDNCGREYQKYDKQVLNWTVFVNKPYFDSYATIQSAKAAYKDVLSDVGLNRTVIDDHDSRIINEVKTGTYKYTGSIGKKPGIPDRESDVGGLENYPSVSMADDFDSDADGLPDWWENMYGLNAVSAKGDFSDANKDRLGDGWTELERYLEWLARANFTFEKGETQTIDLSQYTKGYDGGTYTLSNIPSGVTATVSGSKMTVKLSDTFAGVGYITFTLKDNAGDTYSRKIGVTQKLAAVSAQDPEPGVATIAKCGAGSSKQTVEKGAAIVDFCYTWENAKTVEVTGLPEGLLVDTDNINKKVSISGTVNDEPGEYAFLVTSIGGVGEAYVKSGIITVVGEEPDEDGDVTSVAALNQKAFHVAIQNNIVHLYGLPRNVSISVTDLSGKHLMTSKSIVSVNGSAIVNLNDYSRGSYLVNIRGLSNNGSRVNRSMQVQVR